MVGSNPNVSHENSEGDRLSNIPLESEANEMDNEERIVDNLELDDIEIESLTPAKFKLLKFPDPETAYNFYNWYGKVNGFGVRRSKVGRSRIDKKILWVKFVCNREGERDEKYVNMENRKRDHRPFTRCGCAAELRIHLDCSSQLWYVVAFCDDHNHQLVGDKWSGHIRSHRKMSDADIAQLNSMRMSGIRTPQIFGSFSLQSGSATNIGFLMKDAYNQIQKQRKMKGDDFQQALNYLGELQCIDPMLFWKHYIGEDGTSIRLFWSDGSCQLDYQLFGEVLAFDATYGKNKYKCPIVVFSGVNHHNQTCVFACAIVTNETQETYVWLLEQFLHAMKGKAPMSVITDGDLAMRNAIGKVFPEAHHRLCIWHLLRNATTNVHKSYFTKNLKMCMVGDYEICEFEEKWKALVEEYGLVENAWVEELYEKKRMWSAAHMRGKFFAGLRTTSRCEGLHAFVGRYVLKGYNFMECIQHFQRALEHLRSNELDADFKSSYGEPVLITEFQSLERFASEVYTFAIFKKIRALIVKTAAYRVLDVKETLSGNIFVIGKYRSPELKWTVAFYSTDNVFKCACRRLESNDIPCVHIIKVIIDLDMNELPRCVVLDRWTKGVKDNYTATSGGRGIIDQSIAMIRYGGLVHSCRDMCKLACYDTNDYNVVRQLVEKQRQELKQKHATRNAAENVKGGDPKVGSTTGGSSTRYIKRKKSIRCSICKVKGHNRATCPFAIQLQRHLEGNVGSSNGGGGLADLEEDVASAEI